jgi:ATP/maltotriose-dependent transcriptional regulator MalT
VLLGELCWSQSTTGRWEEALVARGKVEEARRVLAIYERNRASADVTERAAFRAAEARVLLGEGMQRDAAAAAQSVLDAIDELGASDPSVKLAFPAALEAAFVVGDLERAEALVTQIETLPPGQLAPSLRAHAARFRGRLAASAGDARSADRAYSAAESIFREYTMPFPLAVTVVEHAEWLTSQGRTEEAQPFLNEARETFERLQATPWLERVEAAGASAPAETVA